MADSLKYNMNNQPAIFDNIPIAIYSCDAQGYITSYNKAAKELWGVTPVIGKDKWCGSWKIFDLSGESVSLDSCPMARAIKEGRPIEGEEIVVQRPDGSFCNIMPHPIPFFDESGAVAGAINTLIDVTEQRKNEARQRIMASIVESTDDAIISKTLSGVITSWNKGAEKILKYTEAEILGKSITLLLPSDKIGEESLIIDKIASGETIDHFETKRITKDGHSIPVSLTISPVKNSYGQIIGASKILRDITVQKLAEQALQQHSESLEILNAKKDEFIGLASHELKTPITSINGYLQIIDQKVSSDDDNKVFIHKALLQVKKLSALIADLLDVSKIESGKLPLSFTTFNFLHLVNDVIELLQHSNHSHEIVVNCNATNWIITADKQRIEQVIINLISNAVKYSPNDIRVFVHITCSEDQMVFSVQDFGIGIAQKYHKHIFSKFYRAEDLKANISGLGIGLYISSQIISRHSGKLWFDSKPNEGSTFFFEIPVNQ